MVKLEGITLDGGGWPYKSVNLGLRGGVVCCLGSLGDGGAVPCPAEVFLRRGRLPVGGGGIVGSCAGMCVVLPDAVFCILAHPTAPSAGTLVMLCWGSCVLFCMFGAFGLHRYVFVWMVIVLLGHPRVCLAPLWCHCVPSSCGSVGVAGVGIAGCVGSAGEVVVLYV
jgi:hypothetical protein